MLPPIYIIAALVMGWRYPGILVPAVFYGFTVGAVGGWPQTTSVLVGLSIIMLGVKALAQKAVVSFSAIDAWTLAFIAWCCLSTAWQPNSAEAPATAISFFSATTSIYLLCRLVGAAGVLRDRLLEAAVGFCALSVLLTPMAFSAGTFVYGRLFIGNSPPVGLSQPVPYVVLSVVALMVSEKRNRLLILFATPIALWSAVSMGAGTGTRGAFIAAAAGLSIYILQAGDFRSRVTAIAGLVAAGLAALLLFDQVAELERGLVERLFNFGTYGSIQDLSSVARYDRYRYALYLFERNPITGIGLGGYSALSGFEYPHNLFLEVGAATGLVGLALLFGLFVAVSTKLAGLFHGVYRPQVALLAGMLTVAIVHQQVSFELAQGKGLFLIGLLAGVAVANNKYDASRTSRAAT